MKRLPYFIDPNEKTDNGMEAIQDFFLRWTILCSSAEFETADRSVNEYSRRIVLAMIFGENVPIDAAPSFEGEILGYQLQSEVLRDKKVLSASVARQEKYIDLIAKLVIEENGNERKILLNIEDKYYHNISTKQLDNGREYVESKYREGFDIVNLLIVPDHNKINENIINECKLLKYKIIAISQLQRIAGISHDSPTGNFLFDEFWFEAY